MIGASSSQSGRGCCYKIGAALSPKESAAPTESPIPRHPDEVGACIIRCQLWLRFGGKASSQILSEVVAQAIA
jgi:hypothetical protein